MINDIVLSLCSIIISFMIILNQNKHLDSLALPKKSEFPALYPPDLASPPAAQSSLQSKAGMASVHRGGALAAPPHSNF